VCWDLSTMECSKTRVIDTGETFLSLFCIPVSASSFCVRDSSKTSLESHGEENYPKPYSATKLIDRESEDPFGLISK
jgi:hypothetical protein